jgi:hypothetical protein
MKKDEGVPGYQGGGGAACGYEGDGIKMSKLAAVSYYIVA